MRHERITSWQNPIEKAAWQLRQVCRVLSVRPISLWDCEYGCAPFVLKTADIPADKLMRLRSNLCLWTAPAQPPKPRGKSPGWPQGQSRQPRTRYPLVKKGSNRVKNAETSLLNVLKSSLFTWHCSRIVFLSQFAINLCSKMPPQVRFALLSAAESERLSLNTNPVVVCGNYRGHRGIFQSHAE